MLMIFEDSAGEYLKIAVRGDAFWVGDNLQNGAFIQFGWLFKTLATIACMEIRLVTAQSVWALPRRLPQRYTFAIGSH
jgi:hypothetical protein